MSTRPIHIRVTTAAMQTDQKLHLCCYSDCFSCFIDAYVSWPYTTSQQAKHFDGKLISRPRLSFCPCPTNDFTILQYQYDTNVVCTYFYAINHCRSVLATRNRDFCHCCDSCRSLCKTQGKTFFLLDINIELHAWKYSMNTLYVLYETSWNFISGTRPSRSR